MKNIDFDALARETKQLEVEIAARKKQLAELSDVKKELKELKEQGEIIKKDIKSLNTKRSEFSKKADAANRIFSKKESECNSAEKQILTLKGIISGLEDHKEKLQIELENITEKINDKRAVIITLEKEKKNIEDESREVSGGIAGAKHNLATLNANIEEKRKEHQDVLKNIDESNATLHDYNTQILLLRKTLDELTRRRIRAQEDEKKNTDVLRNEVAAEKEVLAKEREDFIKQTLDLQRREDILRKKIILVKEAAQKIEIQTLEPIKLDI